MDTSPPDGDDARIVYRWLVYVHLAGVFGLLATHGVSILMTLRLRKERDPARIAALLDASSRSISPFYASMLILLAGGVGAAFAGDLWSFGWVWASIAVLLATSVAMFALATRYYAKVRFVVNAAAQGSAAATPEKVEEMLRSGRPHAILAVGTAGLALLLYLMLFKPTLGLAPGDAPLAAQTDNRPVVTIVASPLFTEQRISAPAGVPFTIRFDNRDSGVPHNVSIRSSAGAAFVGATFAGPRVRSYPVPALTAGSYTFVCDVHPTTMTGTLVAE